MGASGCHPRGVGVIDKLLGRAITAQAGTEAVQASMVSTVQAQLDPTDPYTTPPELAVLAGLGEWLDSDAFESVSRTEALKVPGILRARNVIAGTIGLFPLDVLRDGQPLEGPDRPPWVSRPERSTTRVVTIATTVEDLLFDEVAYWRVTERLWAANGMGYPARFERIAPWRVSDNPDRPGRVRIDGIDQDPLDVVQFQSPAKGWKVYGAKAIRTAILLEQAARRNVKTPLPLTQLVAQDPTAAPPLAEAQALLDGYETSRATRSTSYLGGLKAETLSWSPEQLQLMANRDYAVAELARLAELDPYWLGIPGQSRVYKNNVDARRDLVDLTLGKFLQAIEQRLEFEDVTPRGWTVKLNPDVFLRHNTLERMQAYQAGAAVGAYTPEEVRDLENRPPLPAGYTPPAFRDTPPAADTPAPPQEDPTP